MSANVAFYSVIVLLGLVLVILVTIVGINTRNSSKAMEVTMDKVKDELSYNGGSSIKDMIKTLHDNHNAITLSRQRSDFRLEILSDAADVALYETDSNGRVVWCNDVYLHFWGFKTIDEAMSDKWLDQLTPAGKELAYSRLAAIIRSKEAFRFTNTLKTGESIEFVGEPLRQDGQFIGWTGVVRKVENRLSDTD